MSVCVCVCILLYSEVHTQHIKPAQSILLYCCTAVLLLYPVLCTCCVYNRVCTVYCAGCIIYSTLLYSLLQYFCVRTHSILLYTVYDGCIHYSCSKSELLHYGYIVRFKIIHYYIYMITLVNLYAVRKPVKAFT